jgi:hypothetical protein
MNLDSGNGNYFFRFPQKTIKMMVVCFLLQGERGDASPMKPAGKKETTQWYDVGIIKGTSCVVSHYHLPSEASQGNGDVSALIAQLINSENKKDML